ncbi:MAG: hypothetical protein AWU57_183 [Marinobacter sp. T13-3]|nr:MAG: hypothetical protein AWU57_183 [Marinobacter sp. T13-3]
MTTDTNEPSTNKAAATPGQRLKACRVKAGVNQARLAIESGTTSLHIMNLEMATPTGMANSPVSQQHSG